MANDDNTEYYELFFKNGIIDKVKLEKIMNRVNYNGEGGIDEKIE